MLPPDDDDDTWNPRLTAAWGLGGNQGDVRATFRWALGQLEEWLGETEVGGLYRTEPISAIEQADFFNTVAVTVLPSSWLDAGPADDGPAGLVRRLVGLAKELERRAGREVGQRSGPRRDGPRPLDIDLLLLGGGPFLDQVIELPAHDPKLGELSADQWPGPIRVPHLRLAERRFVLCPLHDVLGDIPLLTPKPTGPTTVSEALERLGETQRIEGIPW
jgi:2-amino-4-hydroxy-6-hydroxymethyldihydropteridine diphosphokinase